MVTFEVSTIIWGIGSVVMVILGFLFNRAISNLDARLDKADERACLLDKKVDEIRSDLDHLLGEHETIKESCKTRRRK